MESHGQEFNDAVAGAQTAGYAEADPSFDIDGLDARDKLCILARIAFGARVNVARIPTYRIRHIRAIDTHRRIVWTARYGWSGLRRRLAQTLSFRCGLGSSNAVRCSPK
jgi:homoserine dehydrogenase